MTRRRATRTPAPLTHYAIVQLGYCVFGTGATLEEAEAQAAESLETEHDQETGETRTPLEVAQNAADYGRNVVDGDLVWTRCTRALHEAAQRDSVVYADVDGGICLRSEAE